MGCHLGMTVPLQSPLWHVQRVCATQVEVCALSARCQLLLNKDFADGVGVSCQLGNKPNA